jgi:hypothetical protein
MLIDAVESIGKFIHITAAKVHDKNFMKEIQVPAHSMLVFDKAYNYYLQFAHWTEKTIYFVTRQKKNAVCVIEKTIQENQLQKNKAGVTREEIIIVEQRSKRTTASENILSR